MSFPTWALDPKAKRITVYYESSSTIYEGMPLCYNQDTTDNWTGAGAITATTTATNLTETGTTAEGSQNEGKFIRVEDPASGNLQWLAGYVAGSGHSGQTGPRALDIYVPNEAIIPVRTNKNCTIGDELGLASGVAYLAACTGDGDPAPCAVAMETVDRSGTTGLVLAKVFNTGQTVSALGAYFAPVRGATTGDAYGIRIDLDGFFTEAGTAGPRSWGLGITGDKTAGILTVAGCDDAALRITVNNYVANAEIFNFRGLNTVVSNRSGGIVGELSNIVSVSAKSGSTNAKIVGVYIDAQSLSADTADVMYGADVAFNREGGVSTEEAGVNIRTRGTINTAVNTALRISKDATDHGFINLFNIESDAVDVEAATGDTAHDASDIVIPIVYNGSTYYLVAQDSKG